MKRVQLDLKIEKNIPIPAPHRGVNRPLKYPWDKLEIGDSVLIPAKNKSDKETIRTAATSYGRKRKMLFVSRTVEGGVRVWRTK